jgi:hypothetical protein
LIFGQLPYFNHRILDEQIQDLEENASYKEEIKKDKENIKQLKNNRKIRLGKYYMKR